MSPLREGNEATISRYEDYFDAVGLEIVELTPRVIDLATRLRASHGLLTPDAIQAAGALSLRDRTIFITGDAAFLKVAGLEALIV